MKERTGRRKLIKKRKSRKNKEGIRNKKKDRSMMKRTCNVKWIKNRLCTIEKQF